MKLSKLTKASLIVAVFFALDKGLAIIRQLIIARQFGPTPALDAFNVANNLPDLLFALISGGAMAVAVIPVLTEKITLQGRSSAWELFSRIANLAFLVTAALAILIAIFSNQLVRWEVGIAPGFDEPQQNLVASLMRLNLIATLIFSISGLVMAGLQSNQHFLLPAMSPLLYNVGQIFGAVILAPEKGYQIGGLTLPAFGLGVTGLVYGVIIGAVLHLAIQIPALIRYQFVWRPIIGLGNADLRRVLRLLGPRLLTMLAIQLTFIVRDNLASRLESGAISSLTYGWMIQQVPETIIGTALAVALLPTLSEQIARGDEESFRATMEKAARILFALTLPVAAVMALGIGPLLEFAFPGFGDTLLWVTRGYLIGLFGHSLKELTARSFYARQNAVVPLLTAFANTILYIGIGIGFYRVWGAFGISLTDSVVFTAEAVLLLILLNRRLHYPVRLERIPWRAVLSVLSGGGAALAGLYLGANLHPAITGSLALGFGAVAAVPWILPEIRSLLRL